MMKEHLIEAVRLIAADIKSDYPIAAAVTIGTIEQVLSFKKDGRFYAGGRESEYDLFLYLLPPKTLGFVAVFADGSLSGHEGTLARLELKNGGYKYALEYFADGSTKTHFPS